MKKYIFILSMFALTSSVVLAQTEQEPSLFPELDFGVIQAEVDSDEASESEAESILQEQQDSQETVADAVEEDVLNQISEEDIVQEEIDPVNTESMQVDSDEELTGDEETEEEKEKFIYWALNNIQNYPSPIKTVSYCSAYFVLFNDTKKIVQEISGTIGIGDQTQDFSFKDVQAGKSISQPIQLVGEACDFILQIPNIQVDVCRVAHLSKKKCEEKLIFVPIPASKQ